MGVRRNSPRQKTRRRKKKKNENKKKGTNRARERRKLQPTTNRHRHKKNNKTRTATEEERERERDDIQLGRFDGVLPVRVLVPGALFFRQGFFFLSFLATFFFTLSGSFVFLFLLQVLRSSVKFRLLLTQ
jgi:hypothetical protein